MSIEQHNAIAPRLVKTVGTELATLDSFGPKMLIIESLVAGLLVATCLHHNKNPEQVLEILTKGLKTRVDDIIYGPKQ